MKTSDYKSFVYLENGEINFSQFETIKSTKELERGSYIIEAGSVKCISFYMFTQAEFIQAIRGTQDNPIIIVFDEFDNQMKYNESYLKTVIDGNMSISNCIFFASTNYLDKIPKAMCEKPSRFKYCLNIEGIQGISDIIDIITPILNDILSDDDIKNIANGLKGNTIDYIKQFCFDKIMDIKHYGKRKNKIGF